VIPGRDRIADLVALVSRRRWLAGLGLAVLVAGATSLRDVLASRDALTGVPTARVARGDVEIDIEEAGVLRAEQQATVSAPNDNQLVWLAPEGSAVREGDVIVRFEVGKYEIQRRAAESALEVARAELRRAQSDLAAREAGQQKVLIDYQALPELARKGYINQHELEQARLAYEEARAGTRAFDAAVAAARANVEKAQNEAAEWARKLDEGTIHAPRDGIVVHAVHGEGAGARKVAVGMIPFEGQELMFLPDLSTMRVETQIEEVDLSRVRPGSEARIRVDAYPDAVFAGRVASVSSLAREKVSRITGLPTGVKVFDVAVEPIEQDSRLRPGLSAAVEILVSRHEDALYVPLASVFLDELDRTMVYVRGRGGPSPRPVEIAASNDRVAVIASGVEEGDEVLLGLPPVR
jgi:RND family efflux transporter MFP subunit